MTIDLGTMRKRAARAVSRGLQLCVTFIYQRELSLSDLPAAPVCELYADLISAEETLTGREGKGREHPPQHPVHPGPHQRARHGDLAHCRRLTGFSILPLNSELTCIPNFSAVRSQAIHGYYSHRRYLGNFAPP